MKEYRDSVPWRDIGRLAAALGVVLIVYTIGIALVSLDQLLGWLNTLMTRRLARV
jgi:hypothetical protein